MIHLNFVEMICFMNELGTSAKRMKYFSNDINDENKLCKNAMQ